METEMISGKKAGRGEIVQAGEGTPLLEDAQQETLTYSPLIYFLFRKSLFRGLLLSRSRLPLQNYFPPDSQSLRENHADYLWRLFLKQDSLLLPASKSVRAFKIHAEGFLSGATVGTDYLWPIFLSIMLAYPLISTGSSDVFWAFKETGVDGILLTSLPVAISFCLGLIGSIARYGVLTSQHQRIELENLSLYSLYDMFKEGVQLRWLSSENSVDDQLKERLRVIVKIAESANDPTLKVYAISILAAVVDSVPDDAEPEVLNYRGIALNGLNTIIRTQYIASLYARVHRQSLGRFPQGRAKFSIGELSAGFLNLMVSGLRLYAKLRYIKFLVDAAHPFHSNISCEDPTQQAAYVPRAAEEVCTSCGSWPKIPYRDLFSIQDCFDALHATPQTSDTMLAALRTVGENTISHVDLTQQPWQQWPIGAWKDILSEYARVVIQPMRSLNLSQAVSVPPDSAHVEVLANFLDSVPLEQLDFEGQSLSTDNIEALLSALANNTLHFLNLERSLLNTDLSRDFFVRLSGLSNTLQMLNLASNQFNESEVQGLAGALSTLRQLRTFLFSNNGLTATGFQELLDHFPAGLSHIDFSNNHLSQGNFTGLGHYVRQNGVRTLLFSNTGVGNTEISDFSPYIAGSNLSTVDFGHNQISLIGLLPMIPALEASQVADLLLQNNPLGDPGVAVLAQALDTDSLSALNIGNTGFSDSGLQALSRRLATSGLQTLILNGNVFSNFYLPGFAQSVRESQLHALSMMNCRLLDNGLAYLKEAFFNGALTAMDLRKNGITDKGVAQLASDIGHNKTLKQLFLAENPINGMAGSLDVLMSQGLSELDVSQCQLDDTSIAHIAGSTRESTLAQVDLSGNRITDSGVLQFTKSLIAPFDNTINLSATSLTPEQNQAILFSTPTSPLVAVRLNDNPYGLGGALAICRVVYPARLKSFSLNADPMDPAVISTTTCWVSPASRLEPPMLVTFVYGWGVVTIPYRWTSSNIRWSSYNQRVFTQAHHATDANESSLYIFFDMVSDTVSTTFSFYQVLYHIGALLLAFQEELLQYIPRSVKFDYSKLVDTRFWHEMSGFVVRRHVGIGPSFVYDVTRLVKQSAKTSDENKASSVGTSVLDMSLAVLGIFMSYSMSLLINYVTDSAWFGYAFLPIFCNLPDIYRSSYKSYKHYGLFAAIDSGTNAIGRSLPCGRYLLGEDDLCTNTPSH